MDPIRGLQQCVPGMLQQILQPPPPPARSKDGGATSASREFNLPGQGNKPHGRGRDERRRMKGRGRTKRAAGAGGPDTIQGPLKKSSFQML